MVSNEFLVLKANSVEANCSGLLLTMVSAHWYQAGDNTTSFAEPPA